MNSFKSFRFSWAPKVSEDADGNATLNTVRGGVPPTSRVHNTSHSSSIVLPSARGGGGGTAGEGHPSGITSARGSGGIGGMSDRTTASAAAVAPIYFRGVNTLQLMKVGGSGESSSRVSTQRSSIGDGKLSIATSRSDGSSGDSARSTEGGFTSARSNKLKGRRVSVSFTEEKEKVVAILPSPDGDEDGSQNRSVSLKKKT